MDLPAEVKDSVRPYPAIARYLDECHEQIIRLTAERDRARDITVTLEQQNARALELLEAAQMREPSLEEVCSGRYSINDQRTASLVLEAVRVLRGDDAED